MDALVSGSLFLSNGQNTGLHFCSAGSTSGDAGSLDFECTVLGNHFMMKFTAGHDNENTDQLIRATRHIVENQILSRIIYDGIGVFYTIDICKTHLGEIIIPPPDRAPEIDNIAFEQAELFHLLGRNPQVRYALRDFNLGLVSREDCPVFFYKAIETLAKVICDTREMRERDWKRLHSLLGTNYDDIKDLLSLNKKHRHGEHIKFTKDQHSGMMKTTRHFLAKAIDYILQQS